MNARTHNLASLIALSGPAAPRSRDELATDVLRHALMLGEADGAVLALANGRALERRVLMPSMAVPRDLTPGCAATAFEQELLSATHPRTLGDPQSTPRAVETTCPGVEAGPTLFLPLRMRDQSLGILAVHRAAGSPRFTHREVRALVLLAGLAAATLENLRLAEDLERLAVTDELTQVYNYRHLRTSLRRELRRAARFGLPLSVVMLDVDRLKSYNDLHGHLRGSALLKEIAQIFTRHVRTWDLVAKYGGDEFTLILPQTTRAEAAQVAERLRAAVEAHAFPLAEAGAITVSLGLASYPDDGDSATAILQAADRELFSAKRAGRNRVQGEARDAA